jgi:hypothetical protein
VALSTKRELMRGEPKKQSPQQQKDNLAANESSSHDADEGKPTMVH